VIEFAKFYGSDNNMSA